MESTKGISRRGRRMFTDSLAPAEWSFSTYIRPFKSKSSPGTGIKTADAATDVHSVEEVLWAAMAGADVYNNASGVATVDTLVGATDTDRAAGTYTITEDDYSMDDGTGRGASFTITVNGSGVASVTSIDSPGDGYAVDDTFATPSDKQVQQQMILNLNLM